MSIFGSLTTSELLEAVKRRAFLPESQNTLDDDDILKYATEELFDSVVPYIMSHHEEYLTYANDVEIEANKSNYKIPYRAIGRKFRDIKYLDSQSNLYDLTRLQPEDLAYFQDTGTGPFSAFYFKGDEVVLVPGVSSSPTGSLRFLYFMRPNTLVKEKRACKVVAIDNTTGIITVSNIPTNFTVSSNLDFIEYKPGHRLLNFDVTLLGISSVGSSITVDPSSIPSDLNVGDFINTAGESIVPQIPTELHSLLAERTAARCLASLGDLKNLEAANVKIGELENKLGSLVNNRSEGEPIKVNNLGGILRQSKVSRRRFYF